MQPSGPYTRDTFNAEFDEKFEKSYKAGMEETSAYGEPAGDGVDPTIAQSISGKGVIRGKDITRNADAAFRNNAEGRAWFRKAFEDNFYRSKGDYARSVKGELDGLFNNVVKDLGIRKGSKESAAVQWLGEGQRQRTMNGAVVSKETVPYDLQKLKEDFDYTMPNGKKAWENIVAAEGIIRKTYDDYVDRVNGALKKIYPNVEREVEKIMRKATKAPIKVGEIIKTRTRGNFGEIVEIDGDSITVYFKNNRTGKEATVTLPRSEIIPEAIVKEIDKALVNCIDSQIEPVFVLDEVEKGSIKIWLKQMLTNIPDEALRDLDAKKILGNYLVLAKHKILEKMNENNIITNKEDIEPLTHELKVLAQQNNYHIINIASGIDEVKLLTSMNNIGKIANQLPTGSKFTYFVEGSDLEINKQFAIPDETINEIIEKQHIDNVNTMIVKVKQPDYIGKAQWVFHYNGGRLLCTVGDEEWLNEFRLRKIDVRPGDSLKVKMEIREAYDKNNELISKKYTIIEVLEVITLEETEQMSIAVH